MPLRLTLAGAVLFALVATANGAGYRYGAADQAFYIPVVIHAADAAAFPHDGALLDAQGRHMLVDEIIGLVLGATGLSVETLFFAGYLLSLAATWAALILIGAHLYSSPWLVAALGAAFTLRHRIPETSANSFEPYFHPRMLAFALGLLATSAVLRRRAWLAVGLVSAAAVVHVTTAMWFAVLLGVALAILDRRMRILAIVAAMAAAAAGLWALASGRLDAWLAPMDATWLQAVASKDSLFPTAWPAWAWGANLAFPALLWWAHRRRIRTAAAAPEDAALVWGATALVALFLVTFPLVATGTSLFVQLQISRVFWIVEFVALVYVLALADDALASPATSSGSAAGAGGRISRPRVAAVLLIALAVGRGAYIMLVERPERPLFAVHAPESPWEDAMRWIARQPAGVNVLADPGHAWKHGTSVRAAGVHDVFLEEVKDSALAIYSRDVAARVVERTAAVGDFAMLSAERARDLAVRYDLDYLITEADLGLPVAYGNDRFRIYALR